MSESDHDAMVRWQGYSREQRSTVNSLFLTYAAALLALQSSILLAKEITIMRWMTKFKGVAMEGIQFLTNEKGERVAVQIDLRKHADIWEDVYDSLTARKRSREPRESLDSVKERLIKARKLNG